MTRLLLTVPSRRHDCPGGGISNEEAMSLIDGAALQRMGVQVAVMVARGLLIDIARNELLAVAYHTGADYALLQDDDVKTTPASVRNMLRICQDNGFDVLAAPTQLRGSGRPNVAVMDHPLATPDGELVATCSWIGLGLGSVLVSRRAIQTIVDAHRDRHYRSWLMPDRQAWNVFRSDTIAYERLAESERGELPPGESILVADDQVFFFLMREAGLTLRAYLNAVTEHGNMGQYCMGDAV